MGTQYGHYAGTTKININNKICINIVLSLIVEGSVGLQIPSQISVSVYLLLLVYNFSL